MALLWRNADESAERAASALRVRRAGDTRASWEWGLRAPVAAIGIAALAVALVWDIYAGGSRGFGVLQTSLTGIGVVLVSLAVAPRTANLCLGVLAAIGMVGGIELVFHLTGYDLEARFRENVPIFYRQPTEPAGDVFFRRPGPALWTGKVLSAGVALNGFLDDAYGDEPAVSVTYDAEGFRNPADLRDWEIAVAGDSFVELGQLAYDDLFTTRLGAALDVRVKNLGVSYIGPLSALYYLAHYGKAPSTRRVLLVFFEGNDIADLEREQEAVDRFRTTRQREYRVLPPPQASFVGPMYHWLSTVVNRQRTLSRNAYYETDHGSLPVWVLYRPPPPDELSAAQRGLLASVVASLAQVADALGVEPWLIYMPCKRRVLHGRLRFTAGADAQVAAWQPNRLPAFMGAIAARHSVRFFDLTPALVAATEGGRLTYNSVGDTHLNREGSLVVAEALAGALSTARR